MQAYAVDKNIDIVFLKAAQHNVVGDGPLVDIAYTIDLFESLAHIPGRAFAHFTDRQAFLVRCFLQAADRDLVQQQVLGVHALKDQHQA